MKRKSKNLIFKHEYTLKWRDLYKIRLSMEKKLKNLNLNRQQADPIVIILSELVENAFKYSDRKVVTIVLNYKSTKKECINIKLHHPISTFQSNNLKMLLSDISNVNAASDVNQIFIETLREAATMNPKANKFRLSMIRKTAKGALIHIKKSLIYKPGISISIPYVLQ